MPALASLHCVINCVLTPFGMQQCLKSSNLKTCLRTCVAYVSGFRQCGPNKWPHRDPINNVRVHGGVFTDIWAL